MLVLLMSFQPHAVLSQNEVTHLDGFEISPEIISTPILTATEGVNYLYQVEIRNPDDFPVEYFLEASPPGMVIDQETGLIEWQTPLAGIYPVEVVVIDSRGRLDLQIYDLTIDPDSTGTLEIVSEPESQVLLNSLYQYQVVAKGETEGAQYSLTAAPIGMNIDEASGSIDWIADAVDTFSVSINVTNMAGQSARQEFDLQVVAREPGETVRGRLLGLRQGELVVREVISDQYFTLSENTRFSLAEFETAQPYLFEITSLSTSKQSCLLSNEQGLLPQEIGGELVIHCAAGIVTAEELLESIDDLEASGELTPAEEVVASDFAASQQPDARSREIDRAHALVISAEDPDPDWMGTQIDGDQVIVTSPGSVHTVAANKFNADGEATGAIDASMLRFEVRLQRSADEIEWVPRELAEDLVHWTDNPGEFRVHVPEDLEHGRLIVGLRPDFADPGTRAIAERWSQAVMFEVWSVRPGVVELDTSSVVFPRSAENPMGAGSAFTIQELEQHVDVEFASDNLVMPLIVESSTLLEVGDLVDHQWNGDPYGGRIVHTESRSGQTLLLLSPEWNAIYDVMAIEEGFLEKHGVLPGVIAYRIGDEVVPGFDEQYRDPIESLTAAPEAPDAQSSPDGSRTTTTGSRSSRSAGSNLFTRTCKNPTSRPVIAVSNKFKLSPPEASVSLTVATGERASTLDIDCSWQANPDKRFAMPLVVAGPAGVIAQKIFGTEVGVRPIGRVLLNARAEVSALLAFKASFSTSDGLKTNMPELPRTSLAFDSLEGPPIRLSNRIGSDFGVVFFANALSTRGLLGKLARLFSSDEIEIGVEASVSLGIGIGFSGANAAAVYQGETSEVFTDLMFCAKVGISASLLKIMRTLIGNVTVDVELYCKAFTAAIGPQDPFTFNRIQDDFEGNAIATDLSAGSVFELVFGRNISGIVAPTNKSLFPSIFDDRHDAISYDPAECPGRNSNAVGGVSPDRISADMVVCAHSLVCGKSDKPVELCGTGLSVSTVAASGFTGEDVSAEGTIKALSPRGLLKAIEVEVSGDPLIPQVSPLQPLTLSSTRPERTLSFESQCEAEGVARGQSEIQAFLENIFPGQASNIRVCRCDPGDLDCDRIWGSPHLLSADGLALDYYASGDYVLARADGQQPIEVQGRFLPGYDVSWPQAVALQVGSDIVEIHTDTFNAAARVSHRLRIWVNGIEPVDPGHWQPFRTSRALRLPGGGLIVLEAMMSRFQGSISDPSRILLLMPGDHEFPDFGVRVQSLIFDESKSFDFRDVPPILSISMLRGESILGRDSGLLGSKDGDDTNDLTLRGGSVITFADNLTWTELYAQFGASWLVRPYECLFRNGCLDPQFPEQPALVDPERRQFAEAACFGLEGWYREACIHDVGLSGSTELVQGLYQHVEDLNFMADRIKRPGTDFPFLTLTPGTVEPLDSDELHHFTVERVEGEGPYMLTLRPPKNTTAVLHSTGAGSLIHDGDMLVDAVRLSCIPDPEWLELGVAWPFEGSLELWAIDPISGAAGVKLAEMPLPAERLTEHCTDIRFDVASEFLSDAVLRVDNIGGEQKYVQLRPKPGINIADAALQRVAVCPGCELQLELQMQCHGGLQKLGMLDITDATSRLLESREVVCATGSGVAFPRLSMDKVFQATENALYVAPGNLLWDLVKKETSLSNTPQPDLFWNGKPTPFLSQDVFEGNRIVQVISGGHVAGSDTSGHFLALDQHGNVWTWGQNSRGQLGIPSCRLGDDGACVPDQPISDSDFHGTPVKLAPERLPVAIKQIAAGQEFSLALDVNGDVWSWGSNTRFALGNGQFESEHRSLPEKIRNLGLGSQPIGLVAAGSRTGFAATVDGRLFAWGRNFRGALGSGTSEESSPFPTPVTFPGSAGGATGVFPGPNGALVVDQLGQLWGWGNNRSGQITHNDLRSTIPEPVQVVSSGGMAVRYQWAMRGGHASYAMDFYGRLWAWGANDKGELGQGDFDAREGQFPVDLAPLGDVYISAADVSGSGAVILEDSSRRIWGWGPGRLMPNGFGSHEPRPTLIMARPDARPTVEVSSLPAGERLFVGSDRLETIAVVEILDQARRLQETRRVSIQAPGLTFAQSGTNELDLLRNRQMRDAILADSRVICKRPGLVSVGFDLVDEDREVLAAHTVEVECQYPVQFRLVRGLDYSEIVVTSRSQSNLDILISAVDGFTHETIQQQSVTVCAGCESTFTFSEVCPVIGRQLFATVAVRVIDSEFLDYRKINCGRTNSLLHAVEDATFITEHSGRSLAWGRTLKLGLGDPEASRLDVVLEPVELDFSDLLGSRLGEFSSNIAQSQGDRGMVTQARDADGRLWIWGLDIDGRTGTGIHKVTHYNEESGNAALILESPRPIGGALTDGWIEAFPSNLPAALDRSGRLWQWGRNRYGANGNRVPSDQIWPIPVDVPVAIGMFSTPAKDILRPYSLAVSSDGLEVWAWGEVPLVFVGEDIFNSEEGPCNIGRQFELTTNCSPVKILGSGLAGQQIRDMVTTSQVAYFIDALGRIWQWGMVLPGLEETEIAQTDLTPLDGAKVVGLGITPSANAHVLFLIDEFGGLWARGANGSGGTGTGSDEFYVDELSRVAFPIQAGRIVEIAATPDYVLALDENYCFWAWGSRESEGDPGNPFFDLVPPFSTVIAPIPVLPEYSSPGCPLAVSPAITSVPDLDIVDGESFFYQVEVDNPNGFPVKFQLEEAPPGMTLDADSGLLEWLNPQPGAHSVEIRSNDSRGLFDTQLFEVRVAL